MRARIYQPSRNAMQSGNARTRGWVLDFVPSEARSVDPLMGWTSSSDMNAQVKLHFDTKEEAIAYAERHGIDALVREPRRRAPNIRAGGYGENFATHRRGPWTH
ncbi:ETC complex I subunit [Pseudoroseicyclus tamaricis]|uniref:ETC complex I subunit n=1 Tax=Pseudoroseicyclus tamaricis TaxID=2705421 RepID=A0A6B2JV97_9RHOB|nr:ETC complex I subunit [Pseudoroseicyclus tamaricis]NDV01815.1 ETC complex I subunit [Pseudoroseicyclus tamaricis]